MQNVEEDKIIEKFVSTNSEIISFINDQARKGRCVKKESIKKEFGLPDEDLELHLKLIRDIDEYLVPINKDEYCSYAGITKAMREMTAI